MTDSIPRGADLDTWLPSHGITKSIAEILTSGTIKEICNLGSVLAKYNESGEDVALNPSIPPTDNVNNADPQGAKRLEQHVNLSVTLHLHQRESVDSG